MVRKIIFTTLVLMFFACGETEESSEEQKNTFQTEVNTISEKNELTIDIESVNQIFISGYCGPMDTCIKSTYRLYQLNDSMQENLISTLNNSVSIDPCNFEEYSSEYQLYINLKDSTTRNFKMIRESIMENNEKCFEIDDPDYFEYLWTTLDNEWVRLNPE